MVIRRCLIVVTVIAAAALSACGGGAKSPSASVATAPVPKLATPAPVKDVKLYPTVDDYSGLDDYNGLTLGCGSVIHGSNTDTTFGPSSDPDFLVLRQVGFLNIGALDSLREVDIKPDRAVPYYIVKVILGVLPGPRARVTLAISAAKAEVGFMYRKADLAALGDAFAPRGRFRLPKDAARVTFPACPPRVAYWSGGVVFDRPTCARIDLIGADGRVVASKRVRLLVPKC